MSRGLMGSFHAPTTSDGPTMDVLYAVCSERFEPPAYVVRRDDDADTVWVSHDDGALSIGLRPSTVERLGLDAVLSDTEERLSKVRS